MRRNDARLPVPDEFDMTEIAKAAGVPDLYAQYNLFRTLLMHPELAAAIHQLSDVLTFRSALQPQLREIVILRLASKTETEYALHQHRRIAREAGLDAYMIEEVVGGDTVTSGSALERMMVVAVDEVIERGTLSDATWAECLAVVGGDSATMLDLVSTIGTWQFICFILRVINIPVESSD